MNITTPQRLSIAIQKSGRLSKESIKLLTLAGLDIPIRSNQLVYQLEDNDIDLLLVRDDDIPDMVMNGTCDLGIVGQNVLQEAYLARVANGLDGSFQQIRTLGFGQCRLSVAIPSEIKANDVRYLNNKSVATTYPRLFQQFAGSNKLNTAICNLSGSVEVAPRLGLADAICDLVSTGSTLKSNGLKELAVILNSQACLVKSGQFSAKKNQLLEQLLVRFDSICAARDSKYIMLHAPVNNIAQINQIIPCAEKPTVIPLANESDYVALHVVTSEQLFWKNMEQLKEIGCRSILVLPVEKMMR